MEMVFSFYGSNVLNYEQKIKNEKRITVVFFFIFFLILAFRSVDIGIDLNNYEYYFESIKMTSWSDLSNLEVELLYVVLNKIVSSIGGDFQFFLAVVALICVFPFAYFYYKESENAMLTIAIFVNVSIFTMFFSGLRQAISFSVGIIAFYCVRNKKIFKFLFWVLIAYLFHKSAVVLIALYPIYHIRITKKSFQFIVPIMGVLFIFRRQIFDLLLIIFNDFYDREYELADTGAYSILILFVLFTVYSFIEMDDEFVDKDTMGLRNILVVATCIQMFASVHSLAMRMNYYFIPFIPVIISKISTRGNKEDKFIVKIINIVLIAFFLLYFFYEAKNGRDTLRIFPYETFWSR